MSSLRFECVTKKYNEGGGVSSLSCAIENGEFFALLGPSGCGKTTTLRLAAGLEIPDTGLIYIDENEVTHVPPEHRNMAMVFQNYALFPHLNVFDNVAFGPRAHHLHRAEVRVRVEEALALVRMEEFSRRPVADLSGGQQQRVALARALAVQPGILLLDEPLSNLDAELRLNTRYQLTELQQRLGITMVYVTHDQEEALVMADRIAVLNEGICHQVGSPDMLLNKPASPFVQSFLTNRLESMK